MLWPLGFHGKLGGTGAGEYNFRFLSLESLETRTPPCPSISVGAKGSGISILQCQWLQRGALQLAVLIPQFAVLIPQFALLFPTFLVAVPAFLVVVLACVPSCGYTPVSPNGWL